MNSSAIGAAIVRAVAIIDATNADAAELLRQGDFYAYILVNRILFRPFDNDYM